MLARIREDIESAMQRDPSVRSRIEVVLCYPGFHAILLHRVSHAAWGHGWFVLGRMVSHFARVCTGIEIHPGAVIGRRLFIDHGMGVVIGETSNIGDDVTLYHNVTLGGIAPAVDSHTQANQKRHPTLSDNVIVGSGAQILGPIVIGVGARIGANSVVLANVDANTTVVGIPAKPISSRDSEGGTSFDAYGTGSRDVQDPQLSAIDDLLTQVEELSGRVRTLEARLQERTSAGDETDSTSELQSGHSRD